MFRSIISSSFWLSVYCFLRSCGRNIVSFCYFCLYTFTTQSSNTATLFAYTESSWAEHPNEIPGGRKSVRDVVV